MWECDFFILFFGTANRSNVQCIFFFTFYYSTNPGRWCMNSTTNQPNFGLHNQNYQNFWCANIFSVLDKNCFKINSFIWGIKRLAGGALNIILGQNFSKTKLFVLKFSNQKDNYNLLEKEHSPHFSLQQAKQPESPQYR